MHAATVTIGKNKFYTIIDSFSKYGQAYKLNPSQEIEIGH